MKRILPYTLLVCSALGLRAQTVPPREFIVNSWNLDNGLPQSSVNSIVQSHDGYLWLATFGGLVRFDGVRFTVFDRSNTPGMKSDRCTYVTETSDSTLWVGTEGGVVTMRGGVFHTYTTGDGLLSDVVSFIAQGHDGTVWAHTAVYPFQYFEKGKFISPVIEKRPFISGAELRTLNGDFAISGDWIVRKEGKRVFLCLDRRSLTKMTVWDIVRTDNGDVWTATNGDGIYVSTANGLKHVTPAEGLLSGFVHHLFIGKEKELWVGTGTGLSRYSNGRFQNITVADGLPDGDIRAIASDREGNLWIGTTTGGLSRLRKSLFRMYGKQQGLLEDKMLSICERQDGSLLLGTNCGGIYELRNERVTSSPLNRFLLNTCIWAILEDKDRRVWISSGGLLSVKDQVSTRLDNAPGYVGGFMLVLHQDRRGDVWIGTGSGLNRYRHGAMKSFTTLNGMSNNVVRCVFEASDGAFWVGTENGVNIVRGDSVSILGSMPNLFSNYIRAITQDETGTMWLGSYGGGIVRLKDGRSSVITTKEGLFDNIVSHLVDDGQGYFWMGSNRGIARVSRKELNDVADGLAPAVHAVSFGKADGLTSVETNGGFQPSAIRAKDGRLYFPTVAGVAAVEPQVLTENLLAPPVAIERITADDSSFAPQRFEIPFSKATLAFEFTALSFIEPKKVQFKYKLEGFDEDWIDAGTRRTAFYTKPDPGDHVFRVIACNNDGVWNEAGASVAFRVLPPFYATWWFRSILALLFISVGPSIYFWRVSALRADQARQYEISKLLIQNQEAERSRIAQELHDSLGQDLLVIKNRALLSLQSPNGDEASRHHMNQVSSTASIVLKAIREISHNLRPPELDRLGLAETIRSILTTMRESTTMKLTGEVELIDGLIPHELEINVVRILQESLNNIVKHANATEAQITVRRTADTIELSVRDNGGGFSADKARGEITRTEGLGLTGIAERVRILNGTLEIHSHPGTGTVLRVLIPIQTNGASV